MVLAALSSFTNRTPTATDGPKRVYSEDELSVDDSDFGDFLSFLKDEPAQKGTEVPGLLPTYSYDEASTDDSEYGGFMAFLSAPEPKKTVPAYIGIGDDGSSIDESDFASFAAFLSTPSQKNVSPKEQLAQARASVRRQTNDPPAKGAAVALTKQRTAETTPEYESSESSISVSNSRAPPTPASKPALASAKSAKQIRMEIIQRNTKSQQGKEFELPETASTANLHFQRLEDEKEQKAAAARSKVKTKEVEPLPLDHFTKQNEAEMAAKAKASWELAESQMPIGQAYFTAKGEEAKAIALEEQRKLSEENMSAATRHFTKLAEEKEANAKMQDLGEMPAAIQHFTVADRKIKDQKRAEIEAMKENPPDMPPGQAYFTNQANAEREKREAEIKAMRENPQANTVAGQHFDKINEQKKKEYEELLNQPSSVATEYFNKKAEEEKRMFEEAKSRSQTHEVSAATKHFQKLEEDKLRQIEAAKASSKAKGPVEPLPVDYFTKLNDAEMEAKAKAQWEVAEAQISLGQAYFTAKGEEDKVVALEEQRKLSEENMSEATRHFHRIAAEKEASAKEKGVEQMPLAIQHFTLADREIKDKKRAEIEGMKENPPDMPLGQAYFTNQANAEREKRAAEIKEMKENPQPNTVAGQHFEKINQQKKKEMEELLNQPASVATEYFNKKAEEEKQRMSRSSSATHEKCAATQHFENLEKEKARAIEEAKKESLKKKQSEPKATVDWKTVTQQKAPGVPKYYTASAKKLSTQ